MQPWMIPLFNLIGALLGGWLGPYIGERNRIRAQRAELDNILVQLKATTKAVEDMRDDLSTKVWTRQLKKEIAIEALRNVAGAGSYCD